MSLEAAIQENTAAIKELIAKFSAPVASTSAPEVKPVAPKVETKTVTKEEKPAAVTIAVSYDDAKAAILELSETKGRETTVALLSRHGVTKAPNLKPEQYADVLADVKKVLAGEMSPEEALA